MASNSSKVIDILDNTLPKSVTVSAYAKATNKPNSNTVNKTFKITFCTIEAPPNALVWKYDKVSTNTFCFVAGYNPIGTACNTLGETMTVSGEDIGMSGGCHILKCVVK